MKRANLHQLQDQFDLDRRRAEMLRLARDITPQIRADLIELPRAILRGCALAVLLAAIARGML